MEMRYFSLAINLYIFNRYKFLITRPVFRLVDVVIFHVCNNIVTMEVYQ